MAVGSYGIVRPSDVSPEDVEILYHYTRDRKVTSDVVMKRLDASSLLTPLYHNSDTADTDNTDYQPVENVEIIGGYIT